MRDDPIFYSIVVSQEFKGREDGIITPNQRSRGLNLSFAVGGEPYAMLSRVAEEKNEAFRERPVTVSLPL